MKTGALLGIIASAGVLTAVSYTFLTQSTQYVTVAQAKSMKGDNLSLAGVVDKRSIDVSVGENKVRFVLTDDEGNSVRVVYTGPAPTNLLTADRAVALGGMKEDGWFHARNLMLKCPSKYEADKPAMAGKNSQYQPEPMKPAGGDSK